MTSGILEVTWLLKAIFIYRLPRSGAFSLYANCFNHSSSPHPPQKKLPLHQENFRKLKGKVKKDEEQDSKVTKGPRREWCVFSSFFFHLTILCCPQFSFFLKKFEPFLSKDAPAYADKHTKLKSICCLETQWIACNHIMQLITKSISQMLPTNCGLI